MNKIILLTIICAISHKAAWAQTAAVEIYEVTGALDMSVDGLLNSITTNNAGNIGTTPLTGITASSSGSGQGAEFTLTGTASDSKGATVITCTNGGTGYRVGDVLTLSRAASTTAGKFVSNEATDIKITLVAGDISIGGLSGTQDAMKTSITQNNEGILGSTEQPGITASGGSGSGAVFTLNGLASGTSGATVITCTFAGTGYRVGDALTLTKGSSTGQFTSNTVENIIITLVAGDINGYVKVTPSLKFYRNSVGGLFGTNGNFDPAELLGYYVALSKATKFISVKIDFGGETMVPSIKDVSDTALVDTVLSALLPVEDGLNILKLASSADGTYEMNLIKPDDEIKVTRAGKRSIEIAYNPVSVGELTCAAFESLTGADVTDPTTLVAIKNDATTGIVAKSRRTLNVPQKNIFHSVQMTLNGLTPSTEHEIHCYHLMHGIISHNADSATNTMTDLASLSGVSITASKESGAIVDGDTIVLEFTHEKSLAATDTITLSLFNGFDNQQVIKDSDTADVDNCKLQVGITSNNSPVTVTTCAETAGTNNIVITLDSDSTVTGNTGNVMRITFTHGDLLQFQANRAAGSLVTFDLNVEGHGQVLKRFGWTTS
jgi:hypothetical protein